MKIKYIQSALIILLLIIGCGKNNKSTNTIKNDNPITYKKGKYSINSLKSALTWTGKQLSTKEHNGTINIKKGEIIIDDNGLIKGGVEINMETINTTDLKGQWKDKLDGHLKSPDFFDVEKHPIAFLKFNGSGSNNSYEEYKFDGELTIKNITHPISFQSVINNINGKLSARANIVFDRSKYDIRYGSGKFFENLGDNMIYDDIAINVSVITE